MKQGLVVGKFYPFHKGHDYLINTALKNCEHLVIMVVAQPQQQPSGKLREGWLRQAYPSAEVQLVDDIYDDASSQAWADYTIKLLGKAPEIVFTSEEYGEPWARLMGSQHMLVDLERKVVPISATKVRKSPLAEWAFLSPEVRAYYTKRVAVVGADSTGTTTLTKALAQHYHTSWAPEFGRMYTEGRVTSSENTNWYSNELLFIAEQQNKLEDTLAGYSNKIFFCDTDSFTTALWHEALIGNWSSQIEDLFIDRQYEIYLLTDIDIPYVQDEIRQGEDPRQAMHHRFKELLQKYNKPFKLISGDHNSRLRQAIDACDKLIS